MSVLIDNLKSLIRVNKNVPTIPFIVSGAVLLSLGLVGVYWVIRFGHEAVYGVTREVPWGLLIATYEKGFCNACGMGRIYI